MGHEWLGACVQCGEREKGAGEQNECAFLLCLVPHPSCLGFLESIRLPKLKKERKKEKSREDEVLGVAEVGWGPEDF